jgi:hypothetical protein
MPKPATQPADETFPLKLTAAERACLVRDLEALEPGTYDAIQNTPSKQPFQLTFDQLEDLAWAVTAAVRTVPRESRSTHDSLFRKITEAMRLAAEAEEDDDLKHVLAVRKQRNARRK